MTQEEIYTWQVRRVDDWERYWRQRLKMLAAGPGSGATPWVIRAEYQRQMKAASTRLRGTLFDPANGEEANHASRMALKIAPYHFRRDSLLDWELTFLKRKFQHFERQMALSLEAGATIEQIMKHYAIACVWFCRSGEPALMSERILIAGDDADLWPMLAGLATARMFIGQHRLKRTRALEELYWEDHPKEMHPNPTFRELRPVLHAQALDAVAQCVPVTEIGMVANDSQHKLGNVWVAMMNDRDWSKRDQHQKLLFLQALLEVMALMRRSGESKERLQRKPKSNQRPLLIFGEVETAHALFDLSKKVDRIILSQARQRSRDRFSVLSVSEMPGEDVTLENLAAQFSEGQTDLAELFLQKEEITAALKHLKPEQHRTVLLDAAGFSDQEIAELMQVKVKTVEKRLCRLHQKNLRQAGR